MVYTWQQLTFYCFTRHKHQQNRYYRQASPPDPLQLAPRMRVTITIKWGLVRSNFRTDALDREKPVQEHASISNQLKEFWHAGHYRFCYIMWRMRRETSQSIHNLLLHQKTWAKLFHLAIVRSSCSSQCFSFRIRARNKVKQKPVLLPAKLSDSVTNQLRARANYRFCYITGDVMRWWWGDSKNRI